MEPRVLRRIVDRMTNTTLPSADRSQSHARLVRDLFTEVVERGHHEHLRDWLAPSFPGGAEGFLAGVAPLRAAFPDIRYTSTPSSRPTIA